MPVVLADTTWPDLYLTPKALTVVISFSPESKINGLLVSVPGAFSCKFSWISGSPSPLSAFKIQQKRKKLLLLKEITPVCTFWPWICD